MSGAKVSQMWDAGCNYRSRFRVTPNPFKGVIECLPFAWVCDQFKYSFSTGRVIISYGLHRLKHVSCENDLYQQNPSERDSHREGARNRCPSGDQTLQPISNFEESEQQEEHHEWR